MTKTIFTKKLQFCEGGTIFTFAIFTFIKETRTLQPCKNTDYPQESIYDMIKGNESHDGNIKIFDFSI